MDIELDAVDYALLKCLEENNACWKKKAYDWLMDHREELPKLSEISLQTVGRHMDDLHEAALIHSCITSPDSINRDMIIAYSLTEDGEQAIARKRGEYLQDTILHAGQTMLSPHHPDEEPEISRNALINLMCEEFNIGPEVRETVLSGYSMKELVTLMTLHYYRANLNNVLQSENVDSIATLLEHSPKLAAPFMADTALDEIRETVGKTQK